MLLCRMIDLPVLSAPESLYVLNANALVYLTSMLASKIVLVHWLRQHAKHSEIGDRIVYLDKFGRGAAGRTWHRDRRTDTKNARRCRR